MRETVAAARELAGFESAMLALPDGHGGSTSTTPRARSRSRSAQLDAPDLARSPPGCAGTSSYTAADTGGRGFPGHEVLRAGGRHRADRAPDARRRRDSGCCCSPTAPTAGSTTADAELLELLATQAAGGLRMAAAVLELRERAVARPADRPRPPRDVPRRAARRAGRAPAQAALRAAARRRRRLQGDQRHPRPRRGRRRAARVAGCCATVAARPRPRLPHRRRRVRDRLQCAGEDEARAVGWELQARRAPGSARRSRSGSRSPSPARATSSSSPAPTPRSTRSSAAGATACCWRLPASRPDQRIGSGSTVTRSIPPSRISPSTLNSCPGRELDLEHAPAVVLDRLLLGDRAAAQAPGAAGERDPRAGGEHGDVEHAVAGSATPTSEPPPNAPPRRRSPARRRRRSRARRRRGRCTIGRRGRGGAQRADAVGERAEHRLERAWRARPPWRRGRRWRR